MAGPADRSGVYLRVGVYIFLYLAAIFVFARLIIGLGGYFLGVALSQFLAAVSSNWFALRIYGRGRLSDLGLELNLASARNLALGLAGGVGSAALVLAPPVALRSAWFAPIPDSHISWGIFLFTAAGIAAGSAGEEILFRGFGFQSLLRVWGPHTTVFTIGALFAALHGANPNSTWLGILNTAGFGILFGYAFLRSGDLWMPIGLHFGWNFTLPLFGVNVSGLTMRLTGFEMRWNTSPVWSGGEYGPEGSILTTAVLLALSLFIWKAPVRKQESRLFDGE